MSVDLLPCLNNCPQVRRDVMPLVVVEFLMRVADIFVDYFGELNEHAIKDNFIKVYELLDEMLDNGLPLNMELSVLKELVKPPDPFAKVRLPSFHRTIRGISPAGQRKLIDTPLKTQ